MDGVIKSYELAFRVQDSLPALLDISKEPQYVLDAYGVKPGLEGSFARQYLMARRLSEAGVRFVEIRQLGWDHQTNLHNKLIEKSRRVDQPTSALLNDLAQRALLEDTSSVACQPRRVPTAATITSRAIPSSWPTRV